MKVNIVLALAAIVGSIIATSVSGAEYPTKPIRLIVGYQAGGNTDVQARLLAPELNKILGVPVIVYNRPGASGVPAAEMVMRAVPDGHTLAGWARDTSRRSVDAQTLLPYPSRRLLSADDKELSNRGA